MSTLQVLQEASLVNVILVLGTVPYKSPLEHPHNSSSPMPKPQPHTFGDKSHSLTVPWASKQGPGIQGFPLDATSTTTTELDIRSHDIQTSYDIISHNTLYSMHLDYALKRLLHILCLRH